MSLKRENLCITDTLFLFGGLSLTIAITKFTCDIWWASICDGVEIEVVEVALYVDVGHAYLLECLGVNLVE